jgi:hypothetical protein
VIASAPESWDKVVCGMSAVRRRFLLRPLDKVLELAVFAKHVVHPGSALRRMVLPHPLGSEEAPDEAPS